MSETIYYARKPAYENGHKERAFPDVDSAHDFLERVIANDPGVERWTVKEQGKPFPAFLYEVREGTGKVAGTIREIELERGGSDD